MDNKKITSEEYEKYGDKLSFYRDLESFGMINTIAGGVNSENSFRMLSSMNCQYGEGDFISGSFDEKSLSDYIKSFESPMVKGGII